MLFRSEVHTRSGQIFSPLVQPESSIEALAKVKGKQIMVNGEKPGHNPPIQTLDVEMDKDFTKLMIYIKKRDYKIID